MLVSTGMLATVVDGALAVGTKFVHICVYAPRNNDKPAGPAVINTDDWHDSWWFAVLCSSVPTYSSHLFETALASEVVMDLVPVTSPLLCWR